MKNLLFLSVIFSLILFNNCSSDDNDPTVDDKDTCANTPSGATVDTNGCAVVESLIYLDENGVTIKATDDAVVGESYELDGVSYLVVNEVTLRAMIAANADVTKVVTTNVTNMEDMFYQTTSFNQDIGGWDVSSVTDMSGMFYNANALNQDLSIWNVALVTQCTAFAYYTPAWTLPKPTFTNCSE